MTIGTGTDIVSVPRVARLIADHGARFVERWFTAEEIAYCSAKAQPSLHYAARLAAKEAVYKSLNRAGGEAVPWRSIEIGHDRLGVPDVRLSGTLLEGADRAGIGRIRVSLSHCAEFATAVAIADEAG